MSLGTADVDRYFRDGFLFPVAGVEGAQAARWRRRLEEIEAAGIRDGGGRWTAPEYRPWEHADHPLRQPVEEIVRHPALLEAVTALIGPDILVRNVDIFTKLPRGLRGLWRGGHRVSQSIGLHRDSPVDSASNDGALTVWLALSGVTRRGGALQYYAGSHRWQVSEAPDRAENLDLSPRSAEIVAGRKMTTASLRPGQVAIHHPMTLHASPENFTYRRRVGVAIRYIAPSVPPAVSLCGKAVLVAGSAEKSAYCLGDAYTINWWYPGPPLAPSEAGGEREPETALAVGAAAHVPGAEGEEE
jgi:hypothetical protein